MKYFVIIEALGPAWNHSLPMREQEEWPKHAAFMDSLVAERFVLLGGPLGDDTRMLIVNADVESAIEARLAADPWMSMGILRIAKIQPWQILLGHID